MAFTLLSRRELLEKGLALGVVSLAPGLTPAAIAEEWDEPTPRRPTPETVLGPFYKKGAPETHALGTPGEPGMPLAVSGRVLSTRGETLPEAVVEVWQSDHRGRYDLEGYRYRARLRSGADGEYAFESVMPGHYPARVCQHVHYLVIAPGHCPLVTQLYCAPDPVFDRDPGRDFARVPLSTRRGLVRPVLLAGDPGGVRALVT